MSQSGPPTCSRTPTPPLPPPPLLHALEPVHEQHGRRVVGPARTRSPLRRRRPHRRYYTLGGCYARAPRMQRLPARVPVRARCSGGRPGPRVCSRNSVGLVREMTGSGSTSRWCIPSHSVRCAVVSGEGYKHKVGSSVGCDDNIYNSFPAPGAAYTLILSFSWSLTSDPPRFSPFPMYAELSMYE